MLKRFVTAIILAALGASLESCAALPPPPAGHGYYGKIRDGVTVVTNLTQALGTPPASVRSHLSDTNNPHGVTAAQIGAITAESDPTVHAAVGDFSATGTVHRAASVGTGEKWTDSNGCVWRVELSSSFTVTVTPSYDIDITVAWWDPYSYQEGWYYTGHGSPNFVSSDPGLEYFTEEWTEETGYDPDGVGALYTTYKLVAFRDKVTNLVGRVALTNDVPSASPAPLPMYLHALDFADSYPDAAAEYYASHGSGEAGSCSAVRSGGFLYRNFDYPFDDRAEFVVRMSSGPSRFASVGVAQVGTNLTERIVTSGRPSRWYKALPGATVDGINENGVVAEINVVDTAPAWHTTGGLHPLAAVRWVLDNAKSAQGAAEYLAANIRFPQGWTQNFHYMIADEAATYFVEDGKVLLAEEYHEEDEPAVMTNFPLDRFPWAGMGNQRFNLLLGGASITNAWYTKAYRRETTPPWTNDLADVIGYTNEIFDAWSTHPKEYFRGRTTNGQPWWQTVHTSVYDISNRTLRVAVQETDDWHTFQVPTSGGGVDEGVIRGIVGQFAATGTVSRASSVGTAEQWTDANGCVWRFYSNWTLVSDDYGHSYNYPIWADSTPYGSGGWYLTLDDVAPYFDLTHGKNSNIVSFNINTSKDMIFLRGTNLVGRVALTNDIPTTAAQIGAIPSSGTVDSTNYTVSVVFEDGLPVFRFVVTTPDE